MDEILEGKNGNKREAGDRNKKEKVICDLKCLSLLPYFVRIVLKHGVIVKNSRE